jgi:hypothetical protein
MALRSINLSELKGDLNKRGRDRYQNDDLKEMFQALLEGQIENVVWDELFTVTAKTTEKAIANEHAKWRNRAVSVFDSLETQRKLSITWTSEHEMVIVLASE